MYVLSFMCSAKLVFTVSLLHILIHKLPEYKSVTKLNYPCNEKKCHIRSDDRKTVVIRDFTRHPVRLERFALSRWKGKKTFFFKGVEMERKEDGSVQILLWV